MTLFEPNRRHLLAMMAGTVGTTMFGGRARAGTPVVVGTFGGDYQAIMASSVNPLVPGFDVVFDTAVQGPRKTKLLAERRLPRGSMDVAALSDIDMFQMQLSGALANLDAKQIPNLANLLPALRRPYAIPHIYSGLTIVYRTDLFPTPPKSYADLWAPEVRGKVGLSDGNFAQNLIAAAQAAQGGKVTDYEAGKAKLLELKAAGARVYASNEQLAQALKSGEVTSTIMWRARAVQWAAAGIPLSNVAPKEGTLPVTFEVAMPKNAPNPQGAAQYLNAMLAPEAQVAFANKLGYSPTVNNAGLPAERLKTIGFTEEEQSNFFVPDYEVIAKNVTAWSDWWKSVYLA